MSIVQMEKKIINTWAPRHTRIHLGEMLKRVWEKGEQFALTYRGKVKAIVTHPNIFSDEQFQVLNEIVKLSPKARERLWAILEGELDSIKQDSTEYIFLDKLGTQTIKYFKKEKTKINRRLVSKLLSLTQEESKPEEYEE